MLQSDNSQVPIPYSASGKDVLGIKVEIERSLGNSRCARHVVQSCSLDAIAQEQACAASRITPRLSPPVLSWGLGMRLWERFPGANEDFRDIDVMRLCHRIKHRTPNVVRGGGMILETVG